MPVESKPHPHISLNIHFNITIFSTSKFPKWSPLHRFSEKFVRISHLSRAYHMSYPSCPNFLDHADNIC
jgi:hypothetical protein